MRDFQKKRVYGWEDKHIGPRDRSLVPFDQIQHIVNHCWPAEHPPLVRPLNPRKHAAGTGHRYRVRFPEHRSTPTWIILHELAHALTYGDGHGPQFVGVYMQLVNKHLNIPLPLLHFTARRAGVKFEVTPTYNLSGEYE